MDRSTSLSNYNFLSFVHESMGMDVAILLFLEGKSLGRVFFYLFLFFYMMSTNIMSLRSCTMYGQTVRKTVGALLFRSSLLPGHVTNKLGNGEGHISFVLSSVENGLLHYIVIGLLKSFFSSFLNSASALYALASKCSTTSTTTT